ncbi:hypothetical protein HPP92_022357 [Vanilla planifolia]|uniref:Callose synthase helical domain-containing protein n=1 Tax=Vanilla planifolia TaxID=51239 RepID=A0A835PT52_VANPL|nr:hypothetical protein HPP92_022357 [Vanilla planifolia]
MDLRLSKLSLVITRITALTGILREEESPELEKGAVSAMQDLYDVLHHDIRFSDMGRLFSNLKWPSVPELKAQIKRLHSLLTIKESAANIPRNLEARRRLEFFTNSLFMRMPDAKPVSEICHSVCFAILFRDCAV